MLTPVMWFVIFAAILLIAVVGLVLWALWMWRKVTALGAEAAELADHAATLAGLLEQIEIPDFSHPEPDDRPRGHVYVEHDRVG